MLRDLYSYLLIHEFVGEIRSFFPWERFPKSPKVSIAIEALVEGIEKTPIKYFIEAFEIIKILLEKSHI